MATDQEYFLTSTTGPGDLYKTGRTDQPQIAIHRLILIRKARWISLEYNNTGISRTTEKVETETIG